MTIREHGRRLYAALDAQDWDLLETLIAPGVTIQVGSEPPRGLEQWKAGQARFYVAFPDGHHVIDRFADGRLLEHRGLLDLDGLRRQLAAA